MNDWKSGFAGFVETPIVSGMTTSDQAIEEARRAGIDLDLLDSNLALPVKERWAQHDGALELALKLEAAGKVRDAKLRPIAAAAR